ncbi:MAG: AAA family ATPase [Candidatus Komeilibacteria bacterium]|jgi:CMP/dCMP kinase|nr:AAA family ATPase [Candidatus Komeilibacteria bacterium]
MNPIITISGPGGSGKSTIAKALVKEYKAERIYVGGIRRQIAKDKGMTLSELNEYALTHPETDIDVDKKAAQDARDFAKDSMVIVEGRTQFYFLPESIKIYIKVTLEEGAKRIWKSLQKEEIKQERNEAKVNSLDELIIKNKRRQEIDKERYKKYYNLDHTDESQYDFVLNTTNINAAEATQKVVNFINSQI